MANPYTFKRKVQQIGKSLFISIPYIWKHAQQLKKGDNLKLECHEDMIILTLANGINDVQPGSQGETSA